MADNARRFNPSQTARFGARHCGRTPPRHEPTAPSRPQGLKAYIGPTVRAKARACRRSLQSPRSICAAATTHVSLGAWPHLSDRSQSPQVKSACRRRAAITRAIGAKKSRSLIFIVLSPAACRWTILRSPPARHGHCGLPLVSCRPRHRVQGRQRLEVWTVFFPGRVGRIARQIPCALPVFLA